METVILRVLIIVHFRDAIEVIISEEINCRIVQTNRAYFANLGLLKSNLLTKSIRPNIYKILIRTDVNKKERERHLPGYCQ